MDTNQIYHMSAVELLSSLPAGSLDLIVTDPTYGIGYKSGCKTGNGGQPRAVKPSFGDDVLQLDWIESAARALKDTGALYTFCHWSKAGLIADELNGCGLKVKQRIVWDKLHWTGGDLDFYGSQTEDVLFSVAPNHHLRWSKRAGNVWPLTKMDSINNEGNYDNPTQKPENLIAKMILNSSDADDLVCDPFCGTGTTLAAARRLGRRWIGCDIDQEQFEIATARLNLPAMQPLFV